MGLMIVHVVACAFMTGLIWIVQTLHYPAFSHITPNGFSDFHANHSRRITTIVGPVMLIELGTGVTLAYQSSGNWFWVCNLSVILLTWALTAWVSVPLHEVLARKHDLRTIDQLVLSNWPRTLLWSTRLIAMLAWTFNSIPMRQI